MDKLDFYVWEAKRKRDRAISTKLRAIFFWVYNNSEIIVTAFMVIFIFAVLFFSWGI